MKNPNRLDEFVEEIEATLRLMPRTERERECNELRQHLETTVERELLTGANEAQAIARAVAEFGRAGDIGRALRRMYWRRQWCDQYRSQCLAIVAGLATLKVAELAIWQIERARLFDVAGYEFMVTMGNIGVPAFLAGITIGWLAPRKSFVVAPTVVGMSVILRLIQWHAAGPHGSMYPTTTTDWILWGFILGIPALVFATTGTWLGRNLPRLSPQRRRLSE